MRDLLPTLPGLGALPLVTSAPASLVDMRGLVADVERRFAALESYCWSVGDTAIKNAEFWRLNGKGEEAVEALAAAPARDLADLIVKARALTSCPEIKSDSERVELVGFSVALDLLRLLAPAPS